VRTTQHFNGTPSPPLLLLLLMLLYTSDGKIHWNRFASPNQSYNFRFGASRGYLQTSGEY